MMLYAGWVVTTLVIVFLVPVVYMGLQERKKKHHRDALFAAVEYPIKVVFSVEALLLNYILTDRQRAMLVGYWLGWGVGRHWGEELYELDSLEDTDWDRVQLLITWELYRLENSGPGVPGFWASGAGELDDDE